MSSAGLVKGSPAEVGLPHQGVFAQLLPTPRVFAFLGLLLVGAIGLGAKEVARWQYLRDSFDTTWGLGMVTAASALVLAVTGLSLGGVVDRRDARPFVLLAMVMSGIGNLVVGTVLLSGPAPLALTLGSAALDGATLGIAAVSVLKVQASFVLPGAEGAVEIANILRLGVGGVVGAVLAGMSSSPGATLLLVGAGLLAASTGLWLVMRTVPPRAPTRTMTNGAGVIAYLRSDTRLGALVRIDLVLALVIPTQLVNLALFDLDVPELAARSIAAGMVGVLVGRLALALLGFRGDPRLLVVGAVVLLAILQAGAGIALTDAWLLHQALALPLIIIVGSVCSTYAQGITASVVQQRVEEGMRGRLGAVLVAGRSILVSAAALGSALLAESLGSPVLLLTLAAALVVVTLGSRAFAAVPQH